MARDQKEPLRALTASERAGLERVARMGSERADRVARARALLAVADGSRFTEAARAAGRRSGDAVGRLVARFNRERRAPDRLPTVSTATILGVLWEAGYRW